MKRPGKLSKWTYLGYYEIIQRDNAPKNIKTKYPKNSYIVFFIAEGEKIKEPYGEEIESSKTFTIEELQEKKILDHVMLWAAISRK